MYRRLLLLVLFSSLLLPLGCGEKPPTQTKPRGSRMIRPPGVEGGPAKPNSNPDSSPPMPRTED